ncbi:MAG TPA: hypothetical protein VMZ00_06485 [Sporichthya sp.]|nr:hypothetical protein [Sporichthya sp.]
MTARRITRAAVAAGVVAAMSAGILAVGQQSSQAADASGTITGRGAQDQDIDVGRKGPSVGDRYVFSENLFNRDGDRIGRLAASCDLAAVKRNSNGKVKDALQHCIGTFRFSDGQVTAQAAFWWSDEKPDLAITGGTGHYDDASGHVSTNFSHGNKSEYDFHFNNNGGPTVIG